MPKLSLEFLPSRCSRVNVQSYPVTLLSLKKSVGTVYLRHAGVAKIPSPHKNYEVHVNVQYLRYTYSDRPSCCLRFGSRKVPGNDLASCMHGFLDLQYDLTITEPTITNAQYSEHVHASHR